MSDLKLSERYQNAIERISVDDLRDPVGLIEQIGLDKMTFFENAYFAYLDFRNSNLSGISFKGTTLKHVKYFSDQRSQILNAGAQVFDEKIYFRQLSDANGEADERRGNLKPTATEHYLTLPERSELFGNSKLTLQRLLQADSNFLLVGSRGSGKSLILKVFEQELRKLGKECIWILHPNFDQPLICGILHAIAEEDKRLDDLGASILSKFRANEPWTNDELSRADSLLENFLSGDDQDKVILLVDDLISIPAEDNFQKRFQSGELLSRLFRSNRVRIVAATAKSDNLIELFGGENANFQPSSDDFHLLDLDVFDNKERFSPFMYFSQYNPYISALPISIKDMLSYYLSHINFRRTMYFLARLEGKEISETKIRELHELLMNEKFEEIRQAYKQSDQNNLDRQVHVIAREVKNSLEKVTTFDRVELDGLKYPYLTSFEVPKFSEPDVIAMLAIDGYVKLESSSANPNVRKISFFNAFDQDWFIKMYNTGDDNRLDDPSA